jgi:hypothetical protein
LKHSPLFSFTTRDNAADIVGDGADCELQSNNQRQVTMAYLHRIVTRLPAGGIVLTVARRHSPERNSAGHDREGRQGCWRTLC